MTRSSGWRSYRFCSGPERQNEQSGDRYCQADLRPLTYKDRVPCEELVDQGRVGEPADGGIRVGSCDRAPTSTATSPTTGGMAAGTRAGFGIFRSPDALCSPCRRV